jgi:hypothetical protein
MCLRSRRWLWPTNAAEIYRYKNWKLQGTASPFSKDKNGGSENLFEGKIMSKNMMCKNMNLRICLSENVHIFCRYFMVVWIFQWHGGSLEFFIYNICFRVALSFSRTAKNVRPFLCDSIKNNAGFEILNKSDKCQGCFGCRK